MKRLSSVTLALAVACTTPQTDPPDAYVAPPETPVRVETPPPPLGWQSQRRGPTLEITEGARRWEVPEGEATAAFVDLTTDGSSRGLWASGATARLYALGDGGAPLIATYEASRGGGIAGSTTTSARLLDLDGDGANELVLRHVLHDDTGSHQRVEVLARTSAGGFGPSTLDAPPERAFFVSGGPIEDAIRTRRGDTARVFALIPLDVIPIPPRPSPNLSSPGFPAGVLFAAVSLIEAGGALTLELDVVRAWPEVQLLASAPIGTMREELADDACRVRVRTGIPIGRATMWGDAPMSRAIALVWADGAARRARVFSWDGVALATLRETVELDRCDTPARDLSLEIDPATHLPSLVPAAVTAPETALW